MHESGRVDDWSVKCDVRNIPNLSVAVCWSLSIKRLDPGNRMYGLDRDQLNSLYTYTLASLLYHIYTTSPTTCHHSKMMRFSKALTRSSLNGRSARQTRNLVVPSSSHRAQEAPVSDTHNAIWHKLISRTLDRRRDTQSSTMSKSTPSPTGNRADKTGSMLL